MESENQSDASWRNEEAATKKISSMIRCREEVVEASRKVSKQEKLLYCQMFAYGN